jgi:hypothetical protein
MVKQLRHIDVSKNPDLLRLAEEVAQTGDSVILEKDSTQLATVAPVGSAAKWRPKIPTSAEIEASKAAAGTWSDVDIDEFMKYIYEGRQSSKPPVDL